jgi:hypothetical protein
VLDIIKKMHYEREPRSWNWDKHCSKFHLQIHMIDEWATNCKATHMSNEDQISAFLKTTPKDCTNIELLITKGIIDGYRSRFPTLVGNVIPHLTLSIKVKEHGALAAKRTMANTSFTPGQRSDKHRRMGRASHTTVGKCHLVDGKVVGTIEGLHYSKDIWKAMTSEQKVQVLSLCKEKSTKHSVRATSTAGSGSPPMDVSDQLATLTRAVQSLDSNLEGEHWSSPCHTSPHRRGSRSPERSSSRSRGCN